MPMTSFDASKPIRFDLPLGEIRAGDAGRSVLVPTEALAEIVRAGAPELIASFGRALGSGIGRALRADLAAGSQTIQQAPLELVVEHLDRQWRIVGLGRVLLERWGRALVAVVDDAPLGENGDALMGSTMAGALSEASGTPVRCVRLARDGVRARFLVTGERAAARLEAWLGSGMNWAEALVRLTGGEQEMRGRA